MPNAVQRRVEAYAKRRRWDESKHPRDDRGRFAHKGAAGGKWVARVLAQSRLDMGTMRAGTGEGDVERFFAVAEGMRAAPAAPKRSGPAPVIDVSRNAAVLRIRKTAEVYRGAPGTSADARVARNLTAPALDKVANDVEAGRVTPKQAAGEVLAATAGTWKPEGRAGEPTPAFQLAQQLEGPRPVVRTDPGAVGDYFQADGEVARVARELTAEDLRGTPMQRAAYGSDVRLLQKMTIGPSADQYRYAEKTAVAERLLAARESLSQGGRDDPTSNALRGMLDYWNGYGYAAERQRGLSTRSAPGAREPVIVEPPRRQEWGQAPNALPTATNPKRDTTVDTSRVSGKTEGMTPPTTEKKLTKKERIASAIEAGSRVESTYSRRAGTRYRLVNADGTSEPITNEYVAMIKSGDLVSHDGEYVTPKMRDERQAAYFAEQAKWRAEREAEQAKPLTFATPQDEAAAVSSTLEKLHSTPTASGSIIYNMKGITREEVQALRLHDQGRLDTIYQQSVRIDEYRRTGKIAPYGRVAEGGRIVDNPEFGAFDARRPKTQLEKGWAEQRAAREKARADVEKVYATNIAKFSGKSRAWLLKEARARGIDVPRGASDESITDALARRNIEQANIKDLPTRMGASGDLADAVRAELARKFEPARTKSDYVATMTDVVRDLNAGMGARSTGTLHPLVVKMAYEQLRKEGLDTQRSSTAQKRFRELTGMPEPPADAKPEKIRANELGFGDIVNRGGWNTRVASVVENPDGSITMTTVGPFGDTTTVPGDREFDAKLAPRAGLGGGHQQTRRLLRQVEEDRQERIKNAFATSATAPMVYEAPGDGRPAVYESINMAGKSGEWDTSVTPDLTTKDPANKMISDVGAFDGKQARAELYNPTGPGQPYRARIFDYEDGATLATYESMDLNEAFRWADRVHDTRNGKAMPRRDGVKATYRVEKTKGPNGVGYKVHEDLSTGESRIVSSGIYGDKMQREADRLNKLERRRLGLPEPVKPEDAAWGRVSKGGVQAATTEDLQTAITKPGLPIEKIREMRTELTRRDRGLPAAGSPATANTDPATVAALAGTHTFDTLKAGGFRQGVEAKVGDVAVVHARGDERQGVVTAVSRTGRVEVSYTTRTAISEAERGFTPEPKITTIVAKPGEVWIKAPGRASVERPAAPATKKIMRKAKIGDLVLVQQTRSDFTQGQGRSERVQHVFGKVASTTREGKVKTYVDVHGDTVKLADGEFPRVSPADAVDVDAVLAAARQHTYPQSTTPMPFDSVEAAIRLVRPHIGNQSVKPSTASKPAEGKSKSAFRPGSLLARVQPAEFPQPPGDSAGVRLAKERGITPDWQMEQSDIRKSRGKWDVVMRDREGKPAGSKTFSTKREAEDFIVNARALRAGIAEPSPATAERAVSESDLQAARLQVRSEVMNPASVTAAIDKSASGTADYARKQAEQRLGTTLGADPLLDRLSELTGQSARQDAEARSDQSVIDRLRAIADNPNETPARRAAAAEGAGWAESHRRQPDPGVAEALQAAERDVSAIVAFRDAEAESRREESRLTVDLNKTASVDAARALAAEHPGIEKGMINEDANLARDFGRESAVAAIRAAQIEAIDRRLASARGTRGELGTEEGRTVLDTNIQHMEWERRNLVQQEETARLSAERIKIDLISNFQRREATRAAEIRNQPSGGQIPEFITKAWSDQEDAQRVLDEVNASMPPRNIDVEGIKKAARVEARKLGITDAGMKRMPWQKEEFARQAKASIINALGARPLMEATQREIAVFEQRLQDPNLRPYTREQLQGTLNLLRAGHRGYNTVPVSDADVAKYQRLRDFHVAVWRAASIDNPGSTDARINPELLAGLSEDEKRKVWDLASRIGENAALALIQWFRNGRT